MAWRCTNCGKKEADCTCEAGFSDPEPAFRAMYGDEEADRLENAE